MIKILKGIFYYSGFEYVYRKAKPATGLPALPLWLIGIYIAFFGIASQRYENRVDIIENRANSIFTQLGTSARKSALSRIAKVQNYPCPVKPKIFQPVSMFRSLFGKDSVHKEMLELLRETVEDWKEELEGVRLEGANLEEANLMDANLWEADLEGKQLILGEPRTYTAGAILKGANLDNADLQGARLWEANLKGVILVGTNLGEASLLGASLQGARNLTIEQLSKAKTLYKAILDSALMEQVKEKYPHLLEKPKYDKEIRRF